MIYDFYDPYTRADIEVDQWFDLPPGRKFDVLEENNLAEAFIDLEYAVRFLHDREQGSNKPWVNFNPVRHARSIEIKS